MFSSVTLCIGVKWKIGNESLSNKNRIETKFSCTNQMQLGQIYNKKTAMPYCLHDEEAKEIWHASFVSPKNHNPFSFNSSPLFVRKKMLRHKCLFDRLKSDFCLPVDFAPVHHAECCFVVLCLPSSCLV